MSDEASAFGHNVNNWTRRQHEAFWKWRYAFERVLMLKATPVHNGEEAKARWDRLVYAQKVQADALEELEATVIDEFDATGRGISGEPSHRSESVQRREEDDCTCLSALGALCPKCHAGYGR